MLSTAPRPAAGYCNTRTGDVPEKFRYQLNGGSMATVSVTVTCAARVDPAPALTARVRIAHRDVVARKTNAPVSVSCVGDDGASCTGTMWLVSTSLPDRLRSSASKGTAMKFTVGAGKSKRVSVPIPASTKKRLAKNRKAVVRAYVRTGDGKTVTRLLTLVTR